MQQINHTTKSNTKESPGIEKLLEDMQNLMENKELADVLFLIGKKEHKIYGHKVILEVRCKNFKPCKFEYFRKIAGCSISFSDMIVSHSFDNNVNDYFKALASSILQTSSVVFNVSLSINPCELCSSYLFIRSYPLDAKFLLDNIKLLRKPGKLYGNV